MAQEIDQDAGNHDPSRVAVIRFTPNDLEVPRARLLTHTLFTVVEAINASVARGDTRTIVDIRLPDQHPEWWNIWAWVQAVRGIVQSVTLELPAGAPAINMVLSTADQQAVRDRTVSYLTSADGGFSRGATYDLRSTA